MNVHNHNPGTQDNVDLEALLQKNARESSKPVRSWQIQDGKQLRKRAENRKMMMYVVVGFMIAIVMINIIVLLLIVK